MKSIFNFTMFFYFFATIVHATPVKNNSCPDYKFTSYLPSFSVINPNKKTFNLSDLNDVVRTGTIYWPGNHYTLYRGITESNPQFDYSKVIKSIFGDDYSLVVSPMFWGITMVLKEEKKLSDPFLPIGGLPLEMKQYLADRQILDDVNELLNCQAKNNIKFSEKEIFDYAKDLVNKSFEKMNSKKLIKYYFNINDPDYYSDSVNNSGFGNNAIDLLISSYYDQIAAIYGKKILVFKDTKSRGLDLTYFNYSNNKEFWHNFVDNGEINQPGYVEPNEIVGYQSRQNDRNYADKSIYRKETRNPIEWAFYKYVYQSKNYILVVDGQNNLCMTQDSASQKLYFCEDNWSTAIMKGPIEPPYPKSKSVKNQVPLFGIIKNCENEKNCKIDDAVFKSYGRYSVNAFSQDIIDKINSINTNSIHSKYFTVPVALKDQNPSPSPSINVLSATYVPDNENITNKNEGNVTKAAGLFLNGKSKENYKITTKFLNLPRSNVSMRFKIKWNCGTNKSGDIYEKEVSSSAEGKIIEISCE